MPDIIIRDQTPFRLEIPSPPKAAGDAGDSREQFLKDLFIKPLFTPRPGYPDPSVTEDGEPVTEDSVLAAIYTAFSPYVQTGAERSLKALYTKALLDYRPRLAFKDILAVQAACEEDLPLPDNSLIYTPGTDVIPASKKLLAGKCSRGYWFASTAFCLKADLLGIAAMDKKAFQGMKDALAAKLSQAVNLPGDTVKLMRSFLSEKLDGLTLGVTVRAKADQGETEHSFARILQEWAMEYAAGAPDMFLCPFSASQLARPDSILFLNVEAHAYADEKAITQEYGKIRRALANPPTVLSRSAIQKMGSQEEALRTLMAKKQFGTNKKDITRMLASRKFMRKPPTYMDITRQILAVLKKLGTVQASRNPFQKTSKSYMRPSRRNPDDYNLMGKHKSQGYLPDIHLYIDTSISITEDMYADSVKCAIMLGKKLGIDVYVNFFSTVLSQPYVLHLSGRSVQQAYREFQTFEKVRGGTDFEAVWEYICQSEKRRRECAVMITDFGYDAPARWCRCPKNLFYVPCTGKDWATITRYATEFVESCAHIDTGIRNRILF